MDNLQPGDTISNKYGTRTVMAILPGVVALGSSKEPTTPLFWYTVDQLKYGGYELTLNDEPEE